MEIIKPLLDENFQLVILGTGDQKYHNMLSKASKKFKKKLSANLKFDAILANKIYAGCDMFLMPSLYEPCGLGQLISMKYGTTPVVRATGGLADTVIDYNKNPKRGTGFTFKRVKAEDFLRAIKRASKLYRKKESWRRLMKRVMKKDFSWDNPAKQYINLYKKTLKR